MIYEAAYINEARDHFLSAAYDLKTRKELEAKLHFFPDTLYLDQLEAKKEEIQSIRFLFSTWGMPALTEAEIRAYFPKLEAVFYAAGSVQGFARPYLNCGVKVFSAWLANAIPVAEYTVAQIVLASKGYYQGLRLQEKGGRQAFFDYAHTFPGNYGIKIGILGAGGIGSLVLKKLMDYDVERLVYDPFASDEKLKSLGAKRADLDEIFSQCQTISNHIANLPATQHMLNYQHFSKMLPNATFINTGRGAQVVEEDLIRALREEPARTALLDVTLPEPPDPDSPFWTLPNVFLTPHIAGSMCQEIGRMGAYMAEAYELYIAHQPCRYEVTLPMLKTMA